MADGILAAVGNTPLVRLKRLFRDVDLRVYAKLEALNPGGSIKDRTACSILCDALDRGLLRPGTTVIESSSGNMAIGIAQFCRYHDLKFICVVDAKATQLNVAILKALGATISLVTEPDPATGDFLVARLHRVRELLARDERAFWPDQYRNPNNPRAHHRTMAEIVRALDGKLDVLLCATSTCGTIHGCTDFVRDHGLATTVYAVDAVGSVIFGGKSGKRLIPGHGAGIRPGLYRDDFAEHCIRVTDLECVIGCRRLARTEAILAGGSSGAIVMALDSIKHTLPPGATCVLILADRGERYLDTIFSDEWVAKNFRNRTELAELGQLSL